MDFDEFRSILRDSGVDVWTVIDTAISVAYLDCGKELKNRRDGIIERLFSPIVPRCRNCVLELPRLNEEGIKKEKNQSRVEALTEKESSSHEGKGGSPSTPQLFNRDDQEYETSVDDEQTKILAIKELLEDLDQNEDSLVSLLQNLADMDITFKTLEETDIGRHVNRLRKHSSNEVRRLVKHLIRKWKEIVDEWVKSNSSGDFAASALIADGDSPQQNPKKSLQNVHHEVPNFAYSPNPHNGGSGSDKNNSESEQKAKAVPRREAPTKPTQTTHLASGSTPPSKHRDQKDNLIDPEKLASARKRLHENYQEAQNAKKQRTIQVMEIHDIPKQKGKNAFFPKSKGGFQARHW